MGRGWYTGTSMVDINNDGYLDIYISKSGMEAPEDRANLLYINQKDGTFQEKAPQYGIDHQGFAVNATFFDYDNDNDLDLYLVNQGPVKLKSGNARQLRQHRHDEAGDVLYENNGTTFIDVTAKAGIYSSVIGFAHGVSVGDVNDDGWEDIFVSNDFFEYDYLYINNQDKTFRQTIKDATKHISYYSMGNDMADYNNDGLLDIVVLDMIAEGNRRLYSNLMGMSLTKFRSHLENGLHHQYMANVLHLNNGNGTYSDVGTLAGISNTDWSWAPIFADFDNDGWKDLYVTNGIRKDVRNIDWGKYYFELMGLTGGEHTFEPRQWDVLLDRMPYEPVENYMFRNAGNLAFEKVMDDWGMNQKSWSNGVAYGDLDNDGDLDMVVNNIDQEAFVYENRQKDHHFIRFKFIGPDNNSMGLGTKVTMQSDSLTQFQQHFLARGYRSSMEPVMHFGLGKDTIISKLEVVWPDGRTGIYSNLKADQEVILDYKDSRERDELDKAISTELFETTDLIPQVRHDENDMEDFLRAPTLPYKLSTLGPALAVGDVNGDGRDDFYLGGAFRRSAQLMLQQKEGSFSNSNENLWQEERMFEDVGASLFDADADGDLDLYVVSGGNEHSAENGMLNDRLYINDGLGQFMKSEDALPDINSSGSKVLPFDYDKDGDLDLLVTGRLVPGAYLASANSFLLKNNHGRFEDVTESAAPGLKGLGMVTDALWADYDGDGDADIIAVGEWMQVIIFDNDDEIFTKIENIDNGLEHSDGWWWSIKSNDFDGDGDLDFIAGNMGYNYKFKASISEPLVAYVNDFDGDDLFDLAMGYSQDGEVFPVYDRSYAIAQNRSIATKIPTNNQYAVSTLNDIYGADTLQLASKFLIKTLATSYIENLGHGKFRIRALPNQVQISNVNSIITSDFDDDGHADVLLGGNLHSTDVRTIRNDGSIGTLMIGDGDGNFDFMPNRINGLDISGDVRNIQFIEVHGIPHLLVVKNNDFLQLVKVN